MTFINNKYSRIYFSIIQRATSRDLDCYSEKHHIIPKSLGGSNGPENLVNLSAREHYICHRLLVKMTSGISKRKMSRAFWAMCVLDKTHSRHIPNSRVFQLAKEEYIKTLVGRKLTAETKEKIRKSNLGKIQSEDTKRKRAVSRTGFKNTDETIAKMKESAKKRWQNTSDDLSRIEKIKQARAKQVIVTKIITCPHCGQSGGNRIMPRYHFDNCKLNKT